MGSHRLCQAINHCGLQTKLCLTLMQMAFSEKVQAEVKYYGMGHDPMLTVALPDVVEVENECVCESLL
nr:MAG TPA: hypothetical protein [Siphoviridae sp. ctHdl3]